MKTWFSAAVLALSMALVFAVIACSPQARNNQFDPGGTAYTGGSNGSTNTTNTNAATTNATAIGAPGFLTGSIAITTPANLWEKNIQLSWPPASNASKYNLYTSITPVRPGGAAMSALSTTNVSLNLIAAGSNYFWVEAVASNTNHTNIFMGYQYNAPMGWKIDPVDGATAPSLRCVNVPLNKTLSIWMTNSILNMMSPSIYWIDLKTRGFSGTDLSITFILSNTGTGNHYVSTTNISNADSVNFIQYYPPPFGPMVNMGSGTLSLSISNFGDADGFNAVWVDNVYYASAGPVIILNETFSGRPDSELNGDKQP